MLVQKVKERGGEFEKVKILGCVIEKEKIKEGTRAKDNYVKDGKEVAKAVISFNTRKQIKEEPKKMDSK